MYFSISRSTVARSIFWRTSSLVKLRNMFPICDSDLLVINIFTDEMFWTWRKRSERTVDTDFESLHSSRASRTMTIGGTGRRDRLQWINYEFRQLILQWLISYIWLRLDGFNQSRSELRHLIGKLKGDGRKNEPYVAPVHVIAGAEKAASESSFCKHNLSNSTCNCGLPSSRNPI